MLLYKNDEFKFKQHKYKNQKILKLNDSDIFLN